MIQNKNMKEDDLLLRLFIAKLSFLRFDEKCLLESKMHSITDFLPLSLDALSLQVGRIIRTRIWNPLRLARLAERDIYLMSSYGAKVLFYDDLFFPFLLRHMYDPPYALFYRGDVSVLNRPAVAIVGTRKPSTQGSLDAKKIAQRIAEAGINVISGLAFGIDANAHIGTLMAQGNELFGKTIAVLGSSVDNITPTSNKRIASAILASGGCILSEYHMASSVQSWNFVQRNRIISALSRVVLVMEAPRGSGALITADFALEHNRELCFYKGAFDRSIGTSEVKNLELFDSSMKGKKCIQDYVQDGAPLVSSAEEVLFMLNSITFLEERDFYKKKLDKINELL